MLILIALLIFCTVVVAAQGLTFGKIRPLQLRLQQYAGPRELSAYRRELEKPLIEKLFWPLLRRLAAFVSRFTPGNVISDIDKRLRQADYPFGLTVNAFLLAKVGTL